MCVFKEKNRAAKGMSVVLYGPDSEAASAPSAGWRDDDEADASSQEGEHDDILDTPTLRMTAWILAERGMREGHDAPGRRVNTINFCLLFKNNVYLRVQMMPQFSQSVRICLPYEPWPTFVGTNFCEITIPQAHAILGVPTSQLRYEFAEHAVKRFMSLVKQFDLKTLVRINDLQLGEGLIRWSPTVCILETAAVGNGDGLFCRSQAEAVTIRDFTRAWCEEHWANLVKTASTPNQ